MDADIIADFKQFIIATFSQQSAQLKRELRDELTAVITAVETRLDAKIDNLSGYIADALDTTNNIHDGQLKDHEIRITRLERKSS